ncbi:MATE efflux family protein [Candidatus Vecturithrix granuli]|uniref:MATE efflux family protein n=1 Tax=Vecturithrix granuli TaxID=1499967 RepID=A0A081C2P5_VECG1|nr:MATE efflux family protein [Candidatus Vecturithrix granuli]
MVHAHISEKRQFYQTLVKLAIPVSIQNMISSSLNLVDTIMIGQLGAVEVAAVGLANRLFFVFILVSFAISSGTAIFTAQFWGKKDVQHIGKVMAIALTLIIAVSLIFSFGALVIPDLVMRIFTKDRLVISNGSTYLRVIGWSYLLSAVTMLYAFILRSMEQVKLPMYASTIALGLNTLLNYCLILGHFGFPALGVQGAAIATVIARVIEAAIILVSTYQKRYPAVHLSDFLTIPRVLIKQFFVTTLPVIANEFSWVVGVTTYSIVYGHMGTAEVAAVNIVNPVEQISSGVFFGLASAGSVMIGNQIGAGHEKTAYVYAKRFALSGVIGAIFVGGLIWLNASRITSVFKVTPEIRMFAVNLLFVLSVVLWTRVFNTINVVGVLRGGGDTKFSMYMEIMSIWGVGVPLAFLGGFYWKFPVYWVFALVSLEEVLKMAVGLYRMHSGKWIHNLTHLAGPQKIVCEQ